jgi:fatty acid amide hydrolase 2
LEGRTLISIESNGSIQVSPQLLAAQRRVAQHLQSLGMRLRVVQLPALRKQFDIWSAMMGLANDTPFGTLLGDGKPIKPLWEMLKWCAGKSQHTWMASTLAATDPVPKLFPKAAARMYALGQQLRQEVDGLLGEDGLLLYPSYSVTAPRHKAPARWATRLHMPWAYQAIINVLELPSTQVPLGLDSQGLPLGVQVIGPHLMDHVTIACALELERRFGGWQPPRLAEVRAAEAAP